MLNQAKEKGASGEAFDQLEQTLNELTATVADNDKDNSPNEPPTKAAEDVDPPQDQLQVLIDLYNQGQLQQALVVAKQLLQKFPNAVTVYNIQGAVNAGLKQFNEAIESYKNAIKIKPNSPEVFNNMGISLKNQGKLEEAMEAYNMALSIKPNYAKGYNNKGAALQEQAKFGEAIEAYSKAISIKLDYAEAYHNMGNTLKEQGKLEEAIVAYNKALEIKPDYADTYNNKGLALKEQGKLEEAIDAYQKALSIKPDYADAYNNTGIALKEQGKLEEAIEAYHMALTIKPDYADAYNNTGTALKEQGKLAEAIDAYHKAISIKPDLNEAYYNMGLVLQGIRFSKPVKDLPELIVQLLDKKTFVRPSAICPAAISLVKLDLGFHVLIESYLANQLEQSLEETILSLSKVPLFLKMMQVCPLPDLEIESFLTWLRSEILNNIYQLSRSDANLTFLSTLALQCYTNEYIYSQPDEDTHALKKLESDVLNTLEDGNQPSALAVACLACYKALHDYSWHHLLHITDDLDVLATRQISEFQQENILRTEISVLSEIRDGVSSKVREQYEEYPYPRWINLRIPMVAKPIYKIAQNANLKVIDHKIFECAEPQILIAGCGTGQHSNLTATRFKDCNVLAIDLSLSSLTYAKRKTQELGITNIQYMQADILDLAKLGRQFDIVESFGVLHHMDDPMAGWRVLTDCLRPSGLMMISLYSELARQHIVKMREEVQEGNITADNDGMRHFRNKIIKSSKEHHKKILSSPDFFSFGPLRDLIFHVQEHRFTMLQIKKCLANLSLEFCGFEANEIVQRFKTTNHGSGDPYDLDEWHNFEIENPDTFSRTDGFWCQKIR
jgi:tetratricopeptide (TPR) repeat protein/2-polyprenyl-3-methyl-5-hydroxy-6-metoxy-1,4-benzoquinol methylase